MNLVGGIMVDAFSELRENDESRDSDKRGQCYICSKTKANVKHKFIFRCKNREQLLKSTQIST